MKFFDGIQNFFDSLGGYIKNFSYLFLIFVGAFLLLSVVIIFITSFAYECMLTKTIDKINKFLERNPRINDDNLVAFNNLMKARGVPKILRRQWQQFMLYREHPASYYMSFKHCVENPMRNSTYRQQMTVYKVITCILTALSLVVSVFMSVQSVNSNLVLQDVVIIPATILVLYWIISMVLDLIHNATTSDLFQNYQYFEINMDKAMLTLPEFVDYEVLFSQDEIKRGIPVLFAYLQKRAVQEQQELEKARLKSVDHEKFDFDKAGLDGSLVLDRAMRETENFTAQRKKYMQETERVNNEMTSLENNYKEQVKEYQRQVQSSKETVENLKSQLEQATSTIEINYIKKQIRDENSRQQNAEKEFDITTDKYNQEVKNLKQEIKHYDEETEKAREALETAMLSEFNTYSVKVYNNLEKIVDEKMQGRLDGYKDQIKGLETQLEDKNEELENVYTRYQEVLSQTPQEEYVQQFEEVQPTKKGKKKKGKAKNENLEATQTNEAYNENYSQDENVPYEDNNFNGEYDYQNEGYDNYTQDAQAEDYNYENYGDEAQNVADYDYSQYPTNEDYTLLQEDYNYQDYKEGQYEDNVQEYEPLDNYDNQYIPTDTETENYVPLDDQNEMPIDTNFIVGEEAGSDDESDLPINNDFIVNEPTESNNNFEYKMLDEEDGAPDDELPTASTDKQEVEKTEFDNADFDFDFYNDDIKASTNTKKKDKFNFDFDFGDELNRPEEEVKEEPTDKGEEPKLAEDSEADIGNNEVDDDFDVDEVLGLYNNDKMVETENNFDDEDDDSLPAPSEVRRRVGRPRKIVEEEEIKPKRKPGRPKKVVEEAVNEEPKRRVGRPKKEVSGEPKRKVGRPKKVRVGRPRKTEMAKPVGRPRKVEKTVKRGVGRPKKNGLNHEMVTSAASSTKRVGRPRKAVENAKPEQQPKRRAGRPRKNISNQETVLYSIPTKKVGRPRKIEATLQQEAPKKRRGRPRKEI